MLKPGFNVPPGKLKLVSTYPRYTERGYAETATPVQHPHVYQEGAVCMRHSIFSLM